jgi:hypothetical protein
MTTGRSHGRSSGATIRLCGEPSGKGGPISLSPEPLAVNHLDRLRIGTEVLQQPSIHLDPELAGHGALCLLIPQGRARPCAAAADGAVVILDLVASPLVGRDPIARRGQHEVFFHPLVGPGAPRLEQNEQVQRVTVAGRFATVNWVAPQ